VKKYINSWGIYENQHSSINFPNSLEDLKHSIVKRNNFLSYGMGRSYGDVCLNTDGRLISSKNLSNVIDFNILDGLISCYAGMTLKNLQEYAMKDGWMLPVVPGSQFISIGGAIANDVHGKNHLAEGSFGNHIKEITLLKSDGNIAICSHHTNKDLFIATIGGIGLTGVILSTKIQLKPLKGKHIQVKYKSFNCLENYNDLIEKYKDYEFFVSWVNCKKEKKFNGSMQIGKFCQNPSTHVPKNLTIYKTMPRLKLINKRSKIFFNYLYSKRQNFLNEKTIVDYFQNFLHPLDKIHSWNRLYGKKGFFQFQCQLLSENWISVLKKIFIVINQSNQIPFLPVIKSFSKKSIGILSFPKEGITFSVDFENNGLESINLIRSLNDLTINEGGRIYLAKDALMSKKNFEDSYPLYEKFQAYRDPKISSNMSRRLMDF
jgi:hypothetical protein